MVCVHGADALGRFSHPPGPADDAREGNAMSPQAEPTSAAVAEPAVPAKLLEEGEIVILAIKPSPWFVLISSASVLGVVGIVALVALLAGEVPGAWVPRRVVFSICFLVAVVRVMVAGFQWAGRLYILTNHRLMRIRGVIRVDVCHCPLRQVGEVVGCVSRLERPLGLGSLFFRDREGNLSQADWVNLSRPGEVEQLVNEAIGKTRSLGRSGSQGDRPGRELQRMDAAPGLGRRPGRRASGRRGAGCPGGQ